MALTADGLKEYLRDELGIDTDDVEGDTPLFSSGVADSFSLISLISFIEANCNIRLTPLDVNLDNMDSLNRMMAFIEKRTAAA